jgi:hypothetical protein
MLLLFLRAILVAPLFMVSSALAGTVDRDVPTLPAADQHYLLYMHGGYVEKRGEDGNYQYSVILKELAKADINVIGEVRGSTKFGQYARKIAAGVNTLLDAGVPAQNITVGGHSKGGFLSLIASTMIANPNIRFAIMSACGLESTQFYRPYKKFIKKDAQKLQGNFLVAWEQSDSVAKDCDKALKKSGMPYRNVEMDIGGGHQLFYKPDPVWIKLITDFVRH